MRDVVQLTPQIGGLRDHVRERRSVLLLQTLEEGEPILDLLEARRRSVDVLRVGSQEEGEVLELRLDRLARLDVRSELRVQRGKLADLLPHRAERRQGCVIPLVERRVGVGAEPLEPIRVRQDLPRRHQRLIFVRLRRGLVDLGELEREELGAGCFLLFGGGQARALVADQLPRAERRGHPLARGSQPREFVQQIEVRGRIEQDLVLVLSVEIHQRPGGVAERRTRDERAVHEGAAPALRRDLAADDHFPAVRLFEHRLDGRGLFAGPDQVRAGASADQQPYGADQDGLARAGFSGEHVEAGRELELETIDDGEVGDAEEPNHGTPILSDL